MASCGSCGGNGRSVLAAKEAWNGVPEEQAGGLSVQRAVGGRASIPAPADTAGVQPVRMEFTGTRTGSVTYHGVRGTGRFYRGGASPTGRFANVHPADVAELEASGHWRRVAPAFVDVVQAAPVEQAKHEPEPVAAAGSAPVAVVVAEPPAAPLVQAIEAGDGVVKRKRKTGKSGPQSELRDLPPLDGAA